MYFFQVHTIRINSYGTAGYRRYGKPANHYGSRVFYRQPVFDFGKNCEGMVLAGDHWYYQGFDVTNSANAKDGIRLCGSSCTVDNVRTYHNGNTGLQISRFTSTDTKEEWPSNNLVLNCTSYGNADEGYEDADGFAAKLTIGEGNTFDGCIAYNNADDGWDLFAKVETGSIGAVTIQNCVAYGNVIWKTVLMPATVTDLRWVVQVCQDTTS